MAAGSLDRTERATPKRREEARERGQVGRSADLNSAGVLLAGLFGLLLMGPKVLNAAASAMTDIFGADRASAQRRFPAPACTGW